MASLQLRKNSPLIADILLILWYKRFILQDFYIGNDVVEFINKNNYDTMYTILQVYYVNDTTNYWAIFALLQWLIETQKIQKLAGLTLIHYLPFLHHVHACNAAVHFHNRLLCPKVHYVPSNLASQESGHYHYQVLVLYQHTWYTNLPDPVLVAPLLRSTYYQFPEAGTRYINYKPFNLNILHLFALNLCILHLNWPNTQEKKSFLACAQFDAFSSHCNEL